jgi:dienelactone hydrolase
MNPRFYEDVPLLKITTEKQSLYVQASRYRGLLLVVGPFLDDRLRFRRRLSVGLRAFQQRPGCNADRVAAIGYCIGGCGALELARADAALRGVVSLHGILSAPIPAQRNAVVSKILVLHGDADPVAPTESVIDFQKEMRLAQAN